MPFNNENLRIAIEASLKAGRIIEDIYTSDFEFALKADQSPLTIADTQANECINQFLQNTPFPIISEENKEVDFSERRTWDTCWIVDPLDGTKEFIKKNDEFTVNIALVSSGNPVLGVIYAPVLKLLYFADVHKKVAYKCSNVTDETSIERIQEQAIVLQKPSDELDQIKVVGSRSHMNEQTLNFIEKLKLFEKPIDVVSKGSSLKFCLLAEGNADVYPRFAPTMEWDTAAGQAICNAVDINIISKATQKPLQYNKENLLNPSFLASYYLDFLDKTSL